MARMVSPEKAKINESASSVKLTQSAQVDHQFDQCRLTINLTITRPMACPETFKPNGSGIHVQGLGFGVWDFGH